MKTQVFLFIFLIPFLLLTNLIAQESDMLIDERDNNIYLVKKFGDQWWMCQNLKYDVGEGSFCFDDDETNCMLKGRLYTFDAAVIACPQGYRLPGDDDWKAFEKLLGMEDKELELKYNRNTGKLGKSLMAGGTSGFEAEYAGVKNPKGTDMYFDSQAYFWTSSQWDESNGWSRVLYEQKEGIDRKVVPKNYGLSVRCIKKTTETPE